MDPSYFTQFIRFIRSSYQERIKQTWSGVFMGVIAANNILFAGELANLVGPFWWIAKGCGAVLLAFSTSLATSYATYLIDQYKKRKDDTPKKHKGKGRKAA